MQPRNHPTPPSRRPTASGEWSGRVWREGAREGVVCKRAQCPGTALAICEQASCSRRDRRNYADQGRASEPARSYLAGTRALVAVRASQAWAREDAPQGCRAAGCAAWAGHDLNQSIESEPGTYRTIPSSSIVMVLPHAALRSARAKHPRGEDPMEPSSRSLGSSSRCGRNNKRWGASRQTNVANSLRLKAHRRLYDAKSPKSPSRRDVAWLTWGRIRRNVCLVRPSALHVRPVNHLDRHHRRRRPHHHGQKRR